MRIACGFAGHRPFAADVDGIQRSHLPSVFHAPDGAVHLQLRWIGNGWSHGSRLKRSPCVLADIGKEVFWMVAIVGVGKLYAGAVIGADSVDVRLHDSLAGDLP